MVEGVGYRFNLNFDKTDIDYIINCVFDVTGIVLQVSCRLERRVDYRTFLDKIFETRQTLNVNRVPF